MAGESVQNLTGQLLNTRGAATAADSYLNVINIEALHWELFLAVG
jgi:hypothetical protein